LNEVKRPVIFQSIWTMTQRLPTGNDCFILSDLHLAEGDLDRGQTLGTENFFSDQVFSEMLESLNAHHNPLGSTPVCLIINGDFVDFIRITLVPIGPEAYSTWQSEINKVKPDFKLPDGCVSEKEKKYGLKTNNYKCIWKLHCAMLGHSAFFKSLAAWVRSGNELIINVGNHDPEWYWPLLQSYLRFRLHELSGALEAERSRFENRIAFSIKAFPIYDQVWIDHGHNYEKQTEMDPEYEYHKVAPKRKFMWKKPETPKEETDKELFIPFGSFFNRYLINRVELDFPFIDNLTVKGSMLRALIDENFSKVYKVFKNFAFYCLYVVQKNFQIVFFRLLVGFLLFIVPVIALVLLFNFPITDQFNAMKNADNIFLKGLNWILKYILPIIVSVALRQILKKLLLWFKLTDPPLSVSAFKDLSSDGPLSQYDYIIIGHNHHPQHIVQDGKQYLNSGTWTSKYVQKYERIESGVSHTVVQVSKASNAPVFACIKQWDPMNKMLVNYSSYIPPKD